jgi:hypothetical protein
MNFLRKVLTESRESDFKDKYQTKFADQDMESIIKMVKTLPNGTKFLDFAGRTMPTAFDEEQLDKVQELLRKFVSVGPNLTITDINQYDDLTDLETELKKHENKIRRQVQAIEGANVVYEDDKYTIVNPLTYNASCYYGAGTKWCTSSEQTQSHFNAYNADGKLFYIIDKTLPTSNPFYKVALLQKYDGDQLFYDAPDKPFTQGWILGTPEFEKLMLSIDSYMQENYSDMIKIYSDKVALEKERQRLESERNANIRRQKLVDAQERREVGEWDIDVIDDEESIGAKAHVFLKYLEENENVEIMTPEIKLRIRELNIELDNINRLIDQVTDEERIDELNERKIATEELIEEYSNYIDVYNMIPEGRNGSMALFSVVGTDGVADNEVYAVGTADEAIDEAKRYVSDLLSDAGIEGFNSSFVENYIDFDAWEGYVKEYYEEDVYSNPEVYLNESQRELSFQQEKKINELEAEWESLNEKESETEDEDEIQEISDRIDEIKDEITEIQENPEGDFDEDDIEGVLDELVSEYSNDPKNFYDNMFGDNDYTRFLTRNNLIDLEGLIEGVVETDGVGHSLNSYDGTDYDVSFMDTDYKVLRYE